MLALAVAGAAVGGFGLGALARRWLATLERGAVFRPGWFELAMALVAALGMALAYRLPHWPLVLWIGALAVPLTAVDLKHHRLPNAITLPAIPITAGIVLLTELVNPRAGDLLGAGLGGAGLGLLLLAMAFLAPHAMGLGDVKLSVSLGFALGYLSWAAVVLGVLLAFLTGAVFSLIGIAAKRLTLKSAIAFGPSLLLGSWVVLALPGLLGVLARAG